MARVPLARFVSLVVGTGLVVSCGSGGSGETAATDRTTTTGVTTTSADLTTTSEPTTSLTEPPVETTAETPAPTTAQTCPTVTIYPGVDSPHVMADVNGDDELDTAFTRRIDDQWFAVVEYGGGGSAFITLVDSDPVSNVFVIGPVDFTSTGSQELAVAVGSGAYTTEVGFIRSARLRTHPTRLRHKCAGRVPVGGQRRQFLRHVVWPWARRAIRVHPRCQCSRAELRRRVHAVHA
ncbi:MAG: hypothetical protein R2706_03360 [Acidimicrobiales bacterium]